MTPACHNRAPFVDPNAGWRWVGTAREEIERDRFGQITAITHVPIFRYRWPWFEDRCATHDGAGIGPNGESYPKAHGWDCTGCRWLPEGVL